MEIERKANAKLTQSENKESRHIGHSPATMVYALQRILVTLHHITSEGFSVDVHYDLTIPYGLCTPAHSRHIT
jgi:hypothetical protein